MLSLLSVSLTTSMCPVVGWLKVEGGIIFVTRLRQLAASKCDDLATNLASAVMNKVRAEKQIIPDIEQIDDKGEFMGKEYSHMYMRSKLRCRNIRLVFYFTLGYLPVSTQWKHLVVFAS